MKIFLSYHKNTPIYKSDIFEPIIVGAHYNKVDEIKLRDDSGDNISELNPYYCELTGYYWVLKNYIDNSDEDYIGFAHYRRLPDLLNISKEDLPTIYGIGFSDSIKLFDKMNKTNVLDIVKCYDIILPCSCYMYAQTVNPILRENEPNYNLYDHFKMEHNSDLLDVLNDVIVDNYPEFTQSVSEVYGAEKAHFYNIFIMKKKIMKNFLSWEFSLLTKVGDKIGGWNNINQLRMAGFLGEVIVNIWLNKYLKALKIGYMPIYMVNFETDYIKKANEYHNKNLFREELSELENLFKIASDKIYVAFSIAELYAKLANFQMFDKYIHIIENLAESGEDFFELANICLKYNLDINISKYFKKAIECEPSNKMFAKSYVLYAEKIRDIDMSYNAWENLNKHSLTDNEKEKYEDFLKIYKKVKLLS